MEIRTHLYFIALVFRRSDLSRFIWYFLLILNIIMFCLVIQFNNNLVSNISAVHKKTDKIHSQRFLDKSNDPMPVIIPKIESIKRESYKDILDDGFNFEKFNALGENMGNKLGSVSNYISIKRRLKDIRHPGCLEKSYAIDKLPKASIVIIFCNELLTFVLRAIWGILNQSPKDLVHEIILVDDGSNSTEIVEILPWYVENRLQTYNVRLIRNPTQKHLVEARLVGARSATGEVLVFLEGHCELTPGWLEPLLNHIYKNSHAIAIPILDYIERSTLDIYERNPDGIPMKVDFDWTGNFGYVTINDKGVSNVDPVLSPLMTGGVFAMNRLLFWRNGGYDSGRVAGWGGENFELSFKTWLCGGRLDVVPCSHVAHLDRDFKDRPYGNPEASQYINMMRIANIWMDNYKSYIFAFLRPFWSENNKHINSIEDQLTLKKKLNCKPFSWYIENVIPDKFIPEKHSKYYGRMRNGAEKEICLDNFAVGFGQDTSGKLGQFPCHGDVGYTQYFALSNGHELRVAFNNFCAEISKPSPFEQIELNKCNGNLNQKWKWSPIEGFKHLLSGRCITPLSTLNKSSKNEIGEFSSKLVASPCENRKEQMWSIEFSSNHSSSTKIYQKADNARIRNMQFVDFCLDDFSKIVPYFLQLFPCMQKHEAGETQNFILTNDHELRHLQDCAEVLPCDTSNFCKTSHLILMTFCNKKDEQKWERTEWNGLQHVTSKLCLTASLNNKGRVQLEVQICQEFEGQIWDFDS